MFVALDKDGKRIFSEEAQKNEEYLCPICKSPVIVKDGEINAKHFAHKQGDCKDDWHYDMSEWHRYKQSHFPVESREVVVNNGEETHRADVLIDNTVIEFQHSPITAEEFNKRNTFFEKLGYRVAWVFDFTEKIESGTLEVSEKSDYMYIWKHPMRIFENCFPINDYNKKFALWFAQDTPDDMEIIDKIIWVVRDGDKQILSRFIVSHHDIDMNDEFDVGDLFKSEKGYLDEAINKLKSSNCFYREKISGVCEHPKEDYVCSKSGNFGLDIWSTKGCNHCPYCYMLARKKRNNSTEIKSFCGYPYKARKESSPGYVSEKVAVYDY